MDDLVSRAAADPSEGLSTWRLGRGASWLGKGMPLALSCAVIFSTCRLIVQQCYRHNKHSRFNKHMAEESLLTYRHAQEHREEGTAVHTSNNSMPTYSPPCSIS